MPPKEWPILIEEIATAVDIINEYTGSVTFKEFAANRMMFDAVVRNFGILGEAANRIPVEIRQQYPEIPWAEMRTMRNFVIHQYDMVNPQTIWDTIRDDLPLLQSQLQDILDNE